MQTILAELSITLQSKEPSKDNILATKEFITWMKGKISSPSQYNDLPGLTQQ